MILLLAQLAIVGNIHFKNIKTFRRNYRDHRVLRRLILLLALVMNTRFGQAIIV
jgi:hypothetical protein